MSIENAKNSIKKIIFDKNLVDEFLNLRNDKIFEFCRKNSDLEFTQEEFEHAVKELLISAFPEEFGIDTANDEDLEKVAGGKSNLATKVTASALALMSVGGGLFTKNETPFSAPSAKAGLFSSKYVVPNPWEVDEVIEAVFRSEYCKNGLDLAINKTNQSLESLKEEKDRLNNRIKNIGEAMTAHQETRIYEEEVTVIRNSTDTKEKRERILSGPRLKADMNDDDLKNVYDNDSYYVSMYSRDLKTDEVEIDNRKVCIEDVASLNIIWWNKNEINKFRMKCSDSIRQFNSRISEIGVEISAINQKMDSLKMRKSSGCVGWKEANLGKATVEQFKEKWKTNNFELGKKWWETFIKSGLYYAPNFEEPGIAEKFGKAMARALQPSDDDKIDVDIDLLAIEELLTVYHTKLFELNGHSKDISLSAISGLTGSDEYKKSLDNFGIFSVWSRQESSSVVME